MNTTVRKANIETAGQELGKSLYKVLQSEKYREFHDGDYTNLIEIMAVASNIAIRMIEKDNGAEKKI